ncbi:MAG: phosphoketolase, partial [Cellulomonas sp.]|nr:phosphoketolase [Cellulomonas sp.]
ALATTPVRGYRGEGTTTTPCDMVMLNGLDRFHRDMDGIDRVPKLGSRPAGLRQQMPDARHEARQYTREHGEDMPWIADWVWPDAGDNASETGAAPRGSSAMATGGDNE